MSQSPNESVRSSPADEKLPASITDHGAWTVLRLHEPSLMVPEVIEALSDHADQLLAEKRHRLIIDFSEVQYISSSMVGVLVGTRQAIAKAGGELILAGLNARLVELLKITRLDKMFRLEPDVNTALHHVGSA